MDDNCSLLEVNQLVKYFPVYGSNFLQPPNYVKAVDGLSFKVNRGETLGIVGESGCGKSTVGRVILRLLKPTSGEVLFNGRNTFGLSAKELRNQRREMQVVFQDPYASFNPKMKVEDIIGEPLRIHRIGTIRERTERIYELLETVGLSVSCLQKYPHEFSGGQCQRIALARALALKPKLIIFDEPVSALDVSIQGQIINLLKDMQNEFNLTYLFISHNLAVIRHISHKVAVMYLGKIVEIALADQIFLNPQHPYTKALLSAIPIPDPDVKRQKLILTGEVPNPMNIPKGCRFHTRCTYKIDACQTHEPKLTYIDTHHYVACHLKTELKIKKF